MDNEEWVFLSQGLADKQNCGKFRIKSHFRKFKFKQCRTKEQKKMQGILSFHTSEFHLQCNSILK